VQSILPRPHEDSNPPPGPLKRETPAQRRRRLALLAAEHLARSDARMAAIIRQVGPHRLIITPDPFVTLAGSIVSQQISMAAAASIQRRVRDLCPGGRVRPAAIAALHPRTLRKAGLSRSKVVYIRDLAAQFLSGELTTRKLRAMSDQQVIEAATRVKGIGRWTAEMLLIFCLERPDVWPIDDLGIRKAARNYLGVAELPAKQTMIALGEPWRPYRSYASWFLWRSLEGPLMPGVRLA
jgi:DNA-3-methyladenine glycosylase II